MYVTELTDLSTFSISVYSRHVWGESSPPKEKFQIPPPKKKNLQRVKYRCGKIILCSELHLHSAVDFINNWPLNICSDADVHLYLTRCKFFLGGGNFPPDVPRINTVLNQGRSQDFLCGVHFFLKSANKPVFSVKNLFSRRLGAWLPGPPLAMPLFSMNTEA